jgi:hypothetical protein
MSKIFQGQAFLSPIEWEGEGNEGRGREGRGGEGTSSK